MVKRIALTLAILLFTAACGAGESGPEETVQVPEATAPPVLATSIDDLILRNT